MTCCSNVKATGEGPVGDDEGPRTIHSHVQEVSCRAPNGEWLHFQNYSVLTHHILCCLWVHISLLGAVHAELIYFLPYNCLLDITSSSAKLI